MPVQFTLNGAPVVVEGIDPHTSLLQWLRNSGHTGTKEGCAEGECGACAVAVVARDRHGRSCYEPVNACLIPLAAAHGRQWTTVEGVAAGRELHPVQTAMVSAGGSQCGYCTPGFVMSLFCEYYRAPGSEPDVEAIAGNLCRCTGYRPIVDVCKALPATIEPDVHVSRLRAREPGACASVYQSGDRRFFRPTTLDELFEVLRQYPNATLLAGGTDVMVEVNQRFKRHSSLVSLEAIDSQRQVRWTDSMLSLGAGVTLSTVEQHVQEAPDAPNALRQLWPLFSSRLIRNRATLGGNLATASPIGDAAPVLMALDASLRLVSVQGERVVALHDFYRGYRETVLQPGEVIAEVQLPRPFAANTRFYKISKRRLDDISTLAAAFALDLDAEQRVTRLRVAFGGIAATPIRAAAAEAVALGQLWNDSTQQQVLGLLAAVGTPLSDHRGSAAYRACMVGESFRRFFAETSGVAL